MASVLVLYYSTYGHTMALAEAVAGGAREVADVTIKRAAELVPEEVARKSGYMLDQPYPEVDPGELPNYDAIIVGTPTRFGNMAAQMKNVLDQTGGAWAQGKLVGKVASAFCSTGTQHGGQESTLLTMMNVFLHHGMVVVGLPYAWQGQMRVDEITGGTPYGITTIAGPDGKRSMTDNEREGARHQGRHVAEIAARLAD